MDKPPCSDCDGRCCRWILLPYNEGQEEIMRLRGCLVVQYSGEKRFFAFKRACSELSPMGRCKIYAHRPKFCREFPFDDGQFCKLLKELEKAAEKNQYFISFP